MPRTGYVNTAFDPNVCPLLQGLSPEEQQARMAEDPLIRRCIEALGTGGTTPMDCKLVHAYHTRSQNGDEAEEAQVSA